MVKKVHYTIELIEISKSFKRLNFANKRSYTTLKSFFLNPWKTLFDDRSVKRVAVQNITMRVPRGASVGVIGRNGSGKSTLLKLITGIYRPDSGRINVHGRVAALIELGAGFHPDFTGRENVILGGLMHGLSRLQIEERLEEIIAFAELEEAIDEPIRCYSSGMFMRLGFSLAVHTDPDILIIDEVLSVGDEAFVRKCKERVAALKAAGKTLLLVTHDLEAALRWCDEVIWLDHGEIKDRGDPRRVIDAYRGFLEKGEEQQLSEKNRQTDHYNTNLLDDQEKSVAFVEQNELSDSFNSDFANAFGVSGGAISLAEFKRWGSRELEIRAVELLDQAGQQRALFHGGDVMIIKIIYKQNEIVDDYHFGIAIRRNDGLMVFGTNTLIEGQTIIIKNDGVITIELKDFSLLEGSYLLDVAVHRSDGYPYDYHSAVLHFAVRSEKPRIGVCAPILTWEVGQL
ncbi:MAG TPA: ABC transporter ATP-binding protein [Oligoflexia bacterium]|mgnify:CR=1 FL=1|nr:ABC transporter ATP-binding protein [Oligoflexia bacterium]HMP26424.1 ABC transporter ATP-binding protein [Oligoflexia bacterium]